jgi:hypothetical protein
MATTSKQQTGNSLITTTLVELVGVGLLVILAGMSDDVGKIMLILMWGFMLGWLLLHTSQLAGMVKAI